MTGCFPAADIENVVAYVRSLSTRQESKRQAAEVDAGKAVFAANCVACHGEEGRATPNWGGRTSLTNSGSMAATPGDPDHALGRATRPHADLGGPGRPPVDRKILASTLSTSGSQPHEQQTVTPHAGGAECALVARDGRAASVIGANGHLLYVAMSSHPAASPMPGPARAAGGGTLSAAGSSCSPQPPGHEQRIPSEADHGNVPSPGPAPSPRQQLESPLGSNTPLMACRRMERLADASRHRA